MKVLVVSSWFPFPPDNGSRSRAYHLLEQLSRLHAITLLSFGRDDGLGHVDPLRAFCSEITVVPPPAAAPASIAQQLSSVPAHLVRTESVGMRRLVEQHREKHDVVVALQASAAFHVVPVVPVVPAVPAVFEEAELGLYRARQYHEPGVIRRVRRGLTRWKYERFVRNLSSQFDRTTVVSERERELLVDAGCAGDRIDVVPNGTLIPDWKPVVNRQLRLVYPGAVTYSANLDAVRYFVRSAWPQIRQERPDLQLWVTGSTEGVVIADLAAEAGVIFTGWVNDINCLIAESLACVVPLRLGGGTRLKILQAMALGTPVISTTQGCEGLDVEPERHLLVADTPEGLAGQAIRLAADAVLSGRLMQEARSLVEDVYSWERVGLALERTLERAVAARQAHGVARC